MNLVDDATIVKGLFPFTLTRSPADIRIGILTIREKWAQTPGADTLAVIPSHILPSQQVVDCLRTSTPLPPGIASIEHPWHIFHYNDPAIRQDFALLTAGRQSAPVPSSNKVRNPEQVFLEPGAVVEDCIINASTGPVWIGRGALVMEGSMIRGPVALCEGSVVKMGAKIYGATTIGPYCVAGGEIKNSVMFGYSNKAHDGYLGDSVLGEWCNLGAGTSNSNLKNNGGNVRPFNPLTGQYAVAGIKCGLLMGDYSRAAINTSFNTGTVTGVCCNIFCDGLTPTWIPSFSWGCEGKRYEFDKAIRDVAVWKNFKHQELTKEEIQKLQFIFDNNSTNSP
ncbi:MAG: glucose-1-phosphate thymidylyltransferase [Williamsia sp.]|nr:glucose-1-phosphate thymidylyltransferase [Williamsia sp.]